MKWEERFEKQFWIDREGSIHKYHGDNDPVSIHLEIAKTFVPDNMYAEDVLSSWGWVRVGATPHFFPIIEQEPTQAQINTLYSLGLYEKLRISEGGGRYVKYTSLNDYQ